MVKVGDRVTWNVWGIQYLGTIVKVFDSSSTLYGDDTVLVCSDSGNIVPVLNFKKV